MDWSLLIIPGGALLRNLAGWIENSAKDGEIQKYEWMQLGSTVARFVLIAGALAFGLNLDATTSTGIAALLDVLPSKLSKIFVK